jgi:hypothetical protein
MTPRYSCGFGGECEEDELGPFATSEACRSRCRPRPNREAELTIFEYAPEEALALAPSDQVRVVRRLTGVTVPPVAARAVLQVISKREEVEWSLLWSLPPATRVALVRYLTGATLTSKQASYFLANFQNIELANRWRSFRAMTNLQPWLEAQYPLDQRIMRDVIAIPELPFASSMPMNYIQLAENLANITMNCSRVDFEGFVAELSHPAPNQVDLEEYRAALDLAILDFLLAWNYIERLSDAELTVLTAKVRQCYQGHEVELRNLVLAGGGQPC